ncbi:MAG: GntR family transcriptional regulator [Bacteroidetes bacterium]|nr:MAG: GntR family transcriptional regulator [Bacteroidota bacterium]
MTEIGKFNKLQIIREVDFGVYLDGEDYGEILMPKKYLTENYKVDDFVDVFVYLDSEDRIVATTEKPYAMVGEFAFLKVVAVNEFGAFLDWGLIKDLLVPFNQQKQKMEEGEFYLVYIYLDEKSERIAASSKLDKFLDKEPVDYEEGQEVNLIIDKQTNIGYKAIINNTHWGVIFKNEIFQPLTKGQKIKGYIKKIREDKKIDLSLYKKGYEKVDDSLNTILDILKENNGFIPISDKSSPETIYNMFGISKKTYKKIIGALYKKKLISIEENGIKLK